MNLEEMKRLKKERGYSNEQICDLSGVPLGTVRKIFSGETKHPRFETLQALEKLFADPHAPNYPGPVYDFYPGQPPVVVKERMPEEYYYQVYHDGQYTADDLDRLRGDDGWGELIDGVIFNMTSPGVTHQLIQSRLCTSIQNYIDSKGGSCIPFTPPLDVYIEKNKKTVLQPDIIVVCDRSVIQDDKIWGAPDLVIEINSPSTRDRDFSAKYVKYRAYGVREYWIVDPKNERIIVHDFADKDIVNVYTFDDKIPVTIWDGDCVIDFALIARKVREVRDESESQEDV